MCILLKLNYAKFGVSSLFFSNVIGEKPLGGLLTPHPLVKEGLIIFTVHLSLFSLGLFGRSKPRRMFGIAPFVSFILISIKLKLVVIHLANQMYVRMVEKTNIGRN